MIPAVERAARELGLTDHDAIHGLVERNLDAHRHARLRRAGWRPLPSGAWLGPMGRTLDFHAAANLARDLEQARRDAEKIRRGQEARSS